MIYVRNLAIMVKSKHDNKKICYDGEKWLLGIEKCENPEMLFVYSVIYRDKLQCQKHLHQILMCF